MDDDFDSSSWRRRAYYEVKTSPSNSTKFDLAKTGWKAWAQVDLCFYLLGQGYDVRVERSANPGTPSVDLIATKEDFEDEGAGEVIYLLEINASELSNGSLRRDEERNVKDTVRDWARMFQELDIS